MGLCVGLMLTFLTISGCTARDGNGRTEIVTWQLANGEPVKPRLLGRTRLNQDRPLPDHLIQVLSSEFSLVTITRRADWVSIGRRTRLPALGPEVDLTRGMIVGILANVGESATGKWPISLRVVRTHAGQGWIEADFASGLYYPVQTAGYLELVYVPGLRAVQRVGINDRIFVIHRQPNLH